MTKLERTVTKTETKEKTVQTCDVCGLNELDLPDNEEIVNITSEPEYEVEYVVIDMVEGEESHFDSYNGARGKYQEIDDEYTKAETHISMSYEFNADFCTHCMNTLLSAFSNYENIDV